MSIAIRPSIFVRPESGDVADGHTVAQDFWFTTGEGVSPMVAASAMTEYFMTHYLCKGASPTDAAAFLYGAFGFLMDVAGKPVITESEQ